MASELREQCRHLMSGYADYLGLHDSQVLDIGIAGDPKPSENYQWFGKDGNKLTTMDVDGQYEPDVVGDICTPPFADNSFDLVILSNTLEHVFDYMAALRGVAKITRKWAIVDTPWMYPFHPDGKFGDYWRMSKMAFQKLLPEVGLEIEVLNQTNLLTSALCRKK